MIVTLTANPSVDRTVEVARIRRGGVVRARGHRVDAGGKGVNVARALAQNGHKAVAVVPSGGAEGAQLQALLGECGLDVRTVPIGGAVRANVTVVEADGTTTKLNEPGPRLSRAELDALVVATAEAVDGADWLVLSGSLPPGAPADLYARLVARLSATGVRIAVDTSGRALSAAVSAGPDLVKPNREELAELTGRPVETIGDAAAAAAALRSHGVRSVLVSLGGDGAVLVTEAGSWHATPPRIEPRSTVGAGDAMLAGYLSAGSDGPGALAEAVAWGSAATALPGSRMPLPREITRDGITVTDLTTAPAHTAHRLTEQQP